VDILTTELFRFTTAAGPDTVWQSLTSPALTGRWFHGLTLESSWLPGGAVTARGVGGRLVGEVLAVSAPRRLSFTLAADEDQPETFVTWDIHDAAAGVPEAGSIVRLYVDEPDGDGETERAWLPVISALQAVLAGSGRRSTPTSS